MINAFERIYNRSKLVWPKTLQVDRGREFMGAVTVAFEEKGCFIRRGIPNLHRNQAVVERFNQTLAIKLFGEQYSKEMVAAVEGNDPQKRVTTWV